MPEPLYILFSQKQPDQATLPSYSQNHIQHDNQAFIPRSYSKLYRNWQYGQDSRKLPICFLIPLHTT